VSDKPTPPPDGKPAKPAKKAPAVPTSAPTKTRWRRALRRLLIVAVAVVLVISIVRAIALRMLPGILDDAAAGYSLSCQYESLGLSLLAGDVEIDHLVLTPREGGDPYVELEFVRADVDTFQLLRGRLLIRRVVADGVDARLERRADGTIDLFEHLAQAGAEDEPVEEVADEEPVAPALPDLSPPIAIEAVRLQHVRLHWNDLAGEEPFAALLEADVRLSDLGAGDLPVRAEITLGLRPGLQRLSLTGTADWDEGGWVADLVLDTEGLRPAELAGYLKPIGIVPVAKALDASLRAHVKIGPPAAEGDALPLLAQLEAVQVSGDDTLALRVDHLGAIATMFDDGGMDVERVELGDGRLLVTTTEDGTTRFGGLEFVPVPASSEDEDETTPDDEAGGAGVRLHALDVRNLSVRHRDERHAPVRDLTVTLAELLVDDLSAGLEPGAEPAPVHARLNLLDAIADLTLDGTLHVAEDGTLAEMTLYGGPIGGPTLDLLLAGAGAKPTFEQAQLEATLRFEQHPGGLMAVDVVGLALSDGERHLAGWDRLDLRVGAGEDPSLGEITVDLHSPRLEVVRDELGGLAVAGFELVGTPEDGAASVATSAPPDPTTDPPTEPTTSSDADSLAEPAAAAPPPTLRRVTLANGVIDLALLGPRGAVETRIDLQAGLTDLTWDDREAQVGLTVGVPESGAEVGLKGSLVLDGPNIGADLGFNASGLTSGPLTRAFPEGIGTDLRDGLLTAHITANSSPAKDGGTRVRAAIEDLKLNERGSLDPRFAISKLLIDAPRLDPAAGEIAIEVFELIGVEVDAVTHADGSLHVAGLVLAPAPADAEPPPTPEPAQLAPAPAPATPLPNLLLKQLTLGLADVSMRDLRTPSAEPLQLTDIRLETTAPIELVGDDPDSGKPTGLKLTGSVHPIVGSLEVDAQVYPFADQLRGWVDVALEGLRGEGLTEWRPDLAASMDGRELSDGVFTMHVEFERRDRRRDPFDFGLGDGLASELAVTDLALRATPDAEPLLGFDEFRAELTSWQPSIGRTSLKRVELYGTRAVIVQSDEGLSVAGFTFPSPPEPEPAEGDVAPEPEAEVEPAPVDEVAADASEVRIEDLVVAGIDLDYRDTTTEPPLLLPLNDFDLSVNNFTTRAFSEDKPFLFDLLIGAGPVPLGSDDELRTAPLFETIEAKGRLAFAPALDGFVDARIRGMELAGLAGPAGGAGITLTDGRLDAKIGVRAPGDGALSTDSTFTFVDLDITEPDDGPIARYLKLPTPLGSVLFVLRDEQGVISIPLKFDVDAEGVGGGQIAAKAISTLGKLILDAIANSPFRVLGAAGDVVGILGKGGEAIGLELDPFSLMGLGGAEDEGRTSLTVAFAALDTELGPEALAELADLAERIEDEELSVRITHTLGIGDRDAANIRANPTTEELTDYTILLRRRRSELLDAREVLAGRLAAVIAAGSRYEIATLTDQLGGLDADLGFVEAALDEGFGLLRAGAERQKPRRTRTACLALGEARLDAIARALLDAGVPAADDVMRIDRPRYIEPTLPAGGQVVLVTAPLTTVEEGWWSKITGTIGDGFGWVFGLFGGGGD
jgi:hypothetical protein